VGMRDGSELHLGAPRPRRGDRRASQPRRLPEVLRAPHGPPGDAQRDATRRRRDVRPERFAPRLAPQAVRRPIHAARPGPDALETRLRAPAPAPVRARTGADLPGGARVPGRLTDPGDLEAAGGDRPRRDFGTIDHGRARNTIALGGPRASRLVLPVLPGATARGTPLPPSTALRGQPGRRYAPASNGG
jgi:hypothetical protein